MRKIFISIVFTGLFGLAPTFGAAAPLTDGRWQLVEAYGKPFRNSAAYIEISRGENRFSGYSTCNRIFGRLSVTGNRLDLSQIGMTKMA